MRQSQCELIFTLTNLIVLTRSLCLIGDDAPDEVWMCGPEVGHQLVEILLQDVSNKDKKNVIRLTKLIFSEQFSAQKIDELIIKL